MRKSFYNVRMRRSRAIILDFMGFTGDFKISRRFRKISGFHVRFLDFTKDFKISRRFQDFTKDFKISRFHSKCTRFQRVANPSDARRSLVRCLSLIRRRAQDGLLSLLHFREHGALYPVLYVGEVQLTIPLIKRSF